MMTSTVVQRYIDIDILKKAISWASPTLLEKVFDVCVKHDMENEQFHWKYYSGKDGHHVHRNDIALMESSKLISKALELVKEKFKHLDNLEM